VVATLVAALLPAGCGSAENAGDTAKIKQTVMAELGDLARGDGVAACALATPTGRTQLAKGSSSRKCTKAIMLVSQNLAPEVKQGLLSVQVNKVTISGGSATVSNADITSTQGSVSGFLDPASTPTVLVKQPDGSWKIAG